MEQVVSSELAWSARRPSLDRGQSPGRPLVRPIQEYAARRRRKISAAFATLPGRRPDSRPAPLLERSGKWLRQSSRGSERPAPVPKAEPYLSRLFYEEVTKRVAPVLGSTQFSCIPPRANWPARSQICTVDEEICAADVSPGPAGHPKFPARPSPAPADRLKLPADDSPGIFPHLPGPADDPPGPANIPPGISRLFSCIKPHPPTITRVAQSFLPASVCSEASPVAGLRSGRNSLSERLALSSPHGVESSYGQPNAAARLPRTLLEAVRYFADADTCREFMVELRWPNGVTCPTCGRTDVRFICDPEAVGVQGRSTPGSSSPSRSGRSSRTRPLGMDKWLPVVWLIANCKNGISSYEVARDLGVTQKTAWFMLQRVRVAMETGTFQQDGRRGRSGRNLHRRARPEHAQEGPGRQDQGHAAPWTRRPSWAS